MTGRPACIARSPGASDHLKEVVHRCLGARAKRYQAAYELIVALRHRPKEVKSGRIRSLMGRSISFTGFLRRSRKEAIAAARKAGVLFQASPGPITDVLVRSPERASGRRKGRRAQADGDPAACRQGAPRDDHRGGAVLEAGKALTGETARCANRQAGGRRHRAVVMPDSILGLPPRAAVGWAAVRCAIAATAGGAARLNAGR